MRRIEIYGMEYHENELNGLSDRVIMMENSTFSVCKSRLNGERREKKPAKFACGWTSGLIEMNESQGEFEKVMIMNFEGGVVVRKSVLVLKKVYFRKNGVDEIFLGYRKNVVCLAGGRVEVYEVTKEANTDGLWFRSDDTSKIVRNDRLAKYGDSATLFRVSLIELVRSGDNFTLVGDGLFPCGLELILFNPRNSKRFELGNVQLINDHRIEFEAEYSKLRKRFIGLRVMVTSEGESWDHLQMKPAGIVLEGNREKAGAQVGLIATAVVLSAVMIFGVSCWTRMMYMKMIKARLAVLQYRARIKRMIRDYLRGRMATGFVTDLWRRRSFGRRVEEMENRALELLKIGQTREEIHQIALEIKDLKNVEWASLHEAVSMELMKCLWRDRHLKSTRGGGENRRARAGNGSEAEGGEQVTEGAGGGVREEDMREENEAEERREGREVKDDGVEEGRMVGEERGDGKEVEDDGVEEGRMVGEERGDGKEVEDDGVEEGRMVGEERGDGKEVEVDGAGEEENDDYAGTGLVPLVEPPLNRRTLPRIRWTTLEEKIELQNRMRRMGVPAGMRRKQKRAAERRKLDSRVNEIVERRRARKLKEQQERDNQQIERNEEEMPRRVGVRIGGALVKREEEMEEDGEERNAERWRMELELRARRRVNGVGRQRGEREKSGEGGVERGTENEETRKKGDKNEEIEKTKDEDEEREKKREDNKEGEKKREDNKEREKKREDNKEGEKKREDNKEWEKKREDNKEGEKKREDNKEREKKREDNTGRRKARDDITKRGKKREDNPESGKKREDNPESGKKREDNPESGKKREDNPESGKKREDNPESGKKREDNPESGKKREDNPESGKKREDNPESGKKREDNPESGKKREDNPESGKKREDNPESGKKREDNPESGKKREDNPESGKKREDNPESGKKREDNPESGKKREDNPESGKKREDNPESGKKREDNPESGKKREDNPESGKKREDNPESGKKREDKTESGKKREDKTESGKKGDENEEREMKEDEEEEEKDRDQKRKRRWFARKLTLIQKIDGVCRRWLDDYNGMEYDRIWTNMFELDEEEENRNEKIWKEEMELGRRYEEKEFRKEGRRMSDIWRHRNERSVWEEEDDKMREGEREAMEQEKEKEFSAECTRLRVYWKNKEKSRRQKRRMQGREDPMPEVEEGEEERMDSNEKERFREEGKRLFAFWRDEATSSPWVQEDNQMIEAEVIQEREFENGAQQLSAVWRDDKEISPLENEDKKGQQEVEKQERTKIQLGIFWVIRMAHLEIWDFGRRTQLVSRKRIVKQVNEWRRKRKKEAKIREKERIKKEAEMEKAKVEEEAKIKEEERMEKGSKLGVSEGMRDGEEGFADEKIEEGIAMERAMMFVRTGNVKRRITDSF
ncbi:putative Ribosome-binding protein [Blattamonas nauphoetae]|uniref:Ribosome-binding protein n=1 Tax=Blattamonas nauphoetae TaxID=2049346 RepID=A0ABQ9XKX2_9EUKA|nr:putative Ribosome-binding protein [Blattamonas nauphoetae]